MVDISNNTGARPISSKDRAETFEEKDVTVSNSGAVQFGGSIVIGKSSTATPRNLINSTTSTASNGMYFTADKEISKIEVKINELNSNFETLFIADSNGNILAEDKTGHSPGDIVTIQANLQQGNEYAIGAYDGGDTFTYSYTSNPDYPVSSRHITVTSVSYKTYSSDPNRYDDRAKVFDYIKTISLSGTSGSATIEWPQPDDIYRWDAATFQASPEGENVGVYIEESTDGGSTWTEIQGPISRGDQIEADPGSRVRFRVELARSDSSNNPSLDSIYRRWVV